MNVFFIITQRVTVMRRIMNKVKNLNAICQINNIFNTRNTTFLTLETNYQQF